MDSTVSPFTLSCELLEHNNAVRCLVALSDGSILTGSRDCLIKWWVPQLKPVDEGGSLTSSSSASSTPRYAVRKTFKGHTHFVASIASMESIGSYNNNDSSNNADGFPSSSLFASGGNDKAILVWTAESDEPVLSLQGHTNVVSCLSFDPKHRLLLSGSWDKTVRIWKGSECLKLIEGQQTEAIWAVLALSHLPHLSFLSASADRSVKLLECYPTESTRSERVVHSYSHLSVVRGLCLFDEERFLACDNSGLVKQWSLKEDELTEKDYKKHENFVYCIASNYSVCSQRGGRASADFASGDEDGVLNIWSQGGCVQSIHHPIEIWCVTFLPNGDIATGTADGMLRIWTKDKERFASKEAIEQYEKTSRKIIPEDDDNIEGVRYDLVVDVFLGEEDTPRKLGMNKGDDPWTIAQQFIEREKTSPNHLEDIAKFIASSLKVPLGPKPQELNDHPPPKEEDDDAPPLYL
eukprot:TRINITY_DN6709_c0_g1_i1.p1 TRINITY_DN6709_c0_g1~~TRINITY_DN6709_c0_g1_i1.p1  ORF type:complete len:465 (-),score=97.52 TRINITY_DN6709_c0_g1_i1:159-1553(-)